MDPCCKKVSDVWYIPSVITVVLTTSRLSMSSHSVCIKISVAILWLSFAELKLVVMNNLLAPRIVLRLDLVVHLGNSVYNYERSYPWQL